LHTCDWTSLTEDTESIGSFQDTDVDFELNAFDEDKENGSEKDVEYMERMMSMLLSARGTISPSTNTDMGQDLNLEERKRLARQTMEKVAKMS
jgi:hypothetical protein